VPQSSFPRAPIRRKRENVIFVIWVVDSKTGAPYNPVIAEEGGAKRRRTKQQVTETKRDFGFRLR
jgi:hypothetical protein